MMPHTQEAACSALSMLLEEGDPERHMALHMPAVLQTLAAALQRYGRRALRSAYDTLATAADRAPGLLSQPALAQVRWGGVVWGGWVAGWVGEALLPAYSVC